jgi:imidazolonepropionase-like amidohydrolase
VPTAEALATATSVAADAFGLGNHKGHLRRGFDADLVLVDGDPFADIGALGLVRAVYVGGRAVTPASGD